MTGAAKVKALYAKIIDLMNDFRNSEKVPELINTNERNRLASIAITEAQGAQMWAVKAIIWKDGAIKYVLTVQGGTYQGKEKEREAGWLVGCTRDSKYVFCSTGDGWIRCYSIEDGKFIRGIKLYHEMVNRMFITSKFVLTLIDSDLNVKPLSDFGI